MREVVVSGVGMVTPSGLTAQESFGNWLQGRSAIGPAPESVTRWLPGMLAACVPAGFESLVDRADRGLDRSAQLGLAAAAEAMRDARLEPDSLAPERSGVYVGVGLAGAQTMEALYSTFYQRVYDPVGSDHRNPTVMHPLTVPRLMANATAAALSMRYRLQGPSQTCCVACASSAVALGEAWRAIRHGLADTVLVVGTEAQITTGAYLGWNALRVLAAPDPEDVAASCKPFDARRNGFVLGEGAAALLLETRAAAEARGAAAYGVLCGYGSSSDAGHLTAPSAEGQARAMRLALDEAGIDPAEVGYINAHGTATGLGDATESQSIAQVFGGHAVHIPISATKSMHGHLIGAAGAVEFGSTLMSLRTGSLPPTANLQQPDPACPLDYIPNEARHGCQVRYALSNSFAFGGSNVALLVRACET
ncbi:MAG: 3-oxoacyl-[acyl-carrier-protein] synthase+ KASII [Burkholderiaceae bacterium]|jgi:3-oxoacyl-[acyl-carrier-protein] synthase II|nr:MAG: 3-oxoacyl-[acyl-carrier-protein] synthase+ KASII [Burkholderiaceae bacterium]